MPSQPPRGYKKGPMLFSKPNMTRAAKSLFAAGAKNVRVRLTPSEVIIEADRAESVEPTATNGGDTANPWQNEIEKLGP
jgi:hypothetical protein